MNYLETEEVGKYLKEILIWNFLTINKNKIVHFFYFYFNFKIYIQHIQFYLNYIQIGLSVSYSKEVIAFNEWQILSHSKIFLIKT